MPPLRKRDEACRRFSTADWAAKPAKGAIRALRAAAVCKTRYAGCAGGGWQLAVIVRPVGGINTQGKKQKEEGTEAAGRAWPSG